MPEKFAWLLPDGEMSQLIRTHDWSTTQLGGLWPAPLRRALNIVLAAKQPMWLAWGEGLLVFFNDAYCQLLKRDASSVLGQSLKTVRHEDWQTVGPRVEQALSGASTFEEDTLLVRSSGNRFFDVSYSPLFDDEGEIDGLFAVVTETTARRKER
jgi:PAS domain S-box-containing protein